MSEDQETTIALVPVAEKQVNFYGDNIITAVVEQSNETRVFVPVRPICEYLGLAWNGQFERLKRHPVLSKAIEGVRVTRTPSTDVTKRSTGGPQVFICLPLEMLPGWLFGIDATRLKPELQGKIIQYQAECFMVLWRAFQGDTFNQGRTTATPPNEARSELEQIRESALAVARLATQQMEVAGRVDRHENRLAAQEVRLEDAAKFMGRIQKRLSDVEEILAPANLISNSQAEQIKSRVHALAGFLMKKDPHSKLQYAAIFTELHRRFGVTDYLHIQIGQFDSVMEFLNDVREAAGTGRLPDQLSMFE